MLRVFSIIFLKLYYPLIAIYSCLYYSYANLIYISLCTIYYLSRKPFNSFCCALVCFKQCLHRMCSHHVLKTSHCLVTWLPTSFFFIVRAFARRKIPIFEMRDGRYSMLIVFLPIFTIDCHSKLIIKIRLRDRIIMYHQLPRCYEKFFNFKIA